MTSFQKIYTDSLSTRKRKGGIFRFIHSGTWFKKISVSVSQNAGSVWTKHLYDTKFMHIQLKASPCGQGLSELCLMCLPHQVMKRIHASEWTRSFMEVSKLAIISFECDHLFIICQH